MPTNPFISAYHFNGNASSSYRGVQVAGPSSGSGAGLSIAVYNGSTGAFITSAAVGGFNAQGFAYVNLYGVSAVASSNQLAVALVNGSTLVEFWAARSAASTAVVAAQAGGPAAVTGQVPQITGTSYEPSGTASGVIRTGTGSNAEDFTWTVTSSGWTNTAGPQAGQTYVVTDNVPPNPISALTATNVHVVPRDDFGRPTGEPEYDSGEVELRWTNPSTGSADWTETHVYRDGVKVATVAKTATGYTAPTSDHLPSTNYTYGVYAVDAAGNHGGMTANVTTPAVFGQTAPPADTPPTAAFTVTKTDLLVQVNASGSTDAEGALTFTWSWGDGATSTGNPTSHTYQAAGTYTITLSVQDTASQVDTESTTVTVTAPVVEPPPDPDPDPDPDPEPDPDPDPDPEPPVPSTLPADVVAFMGRIGDPVLEGMAVKHVPIVSEMVNAYVRGNGPVRNGLGLGDLTFPPDLRAVVITASARLLANPAQLDSESADGYASRGSFSSFSLAETAILHRYRRRAA